MQEKSNYPSTRSRIDSDELLSLTEKLVELVSTSQPPPSQLFSQEISLLKKRFKVTEGIIVVEVKYTAVLQRST
jgi:hypothetical protein